MKGVWPQAQKINGVAYNSNYCNAASITFYFSSFLELEMVKVNLKFNCTLCSY